MKHFILMISALFLLGCESATPDKDTVTYKTLTLGHDGFDFASNTSGGMCDGTSNVTQDISDGMTARWVPAGGTYYAGEENNNIKFTWIHFYNPSESEYRLKDLGAVSLDSVVNADVIWPSVNSEIRALITDHVYIIQTSDGYSKFKVLDIASNDCATVNVEYEFSTTSSFSSQNTTGGNKTTESLWVGHEGSDFSEGLGSDSNCDYNTTILWENDDGFLANFTATDDHLEAPDIENSTDRWFHVSETPDPATDSSDYYLEYKGNIDLASITDISNTWYKRNSKVPSLQIGGVYVIKARDGYVKFKVKEINTTGDACMRVDYVYSATSTF